MPKSFYAVLLALLLPLAASAQVRSIPDNAKRGTMTHVREMLVSIDGQQVRLAAGAQIRSRQNLIIVPTQLPPGSAVKYLLDGSGQVARAWILTDEEAARPDKPAPQ
jgi:hypothetical protein